MSTNLTSEQKLTALVLSAPRDNPFTDDDRPYCALMRAKAALGTEVNGLFDIATEIGFTWGEAEGIMQGWDTADGRRACFDYGSEGSARGARIGAELHRRIHCAS